MSEWIRTVDELPGYDGPDIELFGDPNPEAIAVMLPASPASPNAQSAALKRLLSHPDHRLLIAALPPGGPTQDYFRLIESPEIQTTHGQETALMMANVLRDTWPDLPMGLVDPDPHANTVPHDALRGTRTRWQGVATAANLPLGAASLAFPRLDVSRLDGRAPFAKRWSNAAAHQDKSWRNQLEVERLNETAAALRRKALDTRDQLGLDGPFAKRGKLSKRQLNRELARRHDGTRAYSELLDGRVDIVACGKDQNGAMAVLGGIGFGNAARYVFVVGPSQRATKARNAYTRVHIAETLLDLTKPGYGLLSARVAVAKWALESTVSKQRARAEELLPIPVSALDRVREIVAADSDATTAAFVGYGSPDGVAKCVIEASAEPLDEPPRFILPYDMDPRRGRALQTALVRRGVSPERIQLAHSMALVRGMAAAATGFRRSPAANLHDIWPAANKLRSRPQAL